MNNYIQSKIDHLKRMGLCSAKSPGIGIHGGAAPDWLIEAQKNRK